MNQHSDLFMLAGIAAILRWLEELTILISGPFLTVGLGISLIDLLTGGTLLQSTPWLAFVWAASQAVGIEGQLTGAAFSIRHAWRARNGFAVCGYVLLTAALGYVAFLAAQAFTLHESQGVGVGAALSLIGIDSVSWAFQRAIIAVALVILSALLRYTAPKAQASDEAQKLRDEIELAPLRAQAQAAKAIGVRTVVQAAIKGAPAPVTQPQFTQERTQGELPPNQTPWGDSPWGAPLTPPAGYVQETAASGIQASGPSMWLVPKPDEAPPETTGRTRQRRRRNSSPQRKPRGANSWEAAARQAWATGAHSKRDLMRDVPGISEGSAQYWAGVLRGEERGAEAARKEA